MNYSSKFLASGDAARDLLLEAGYASSAAVDAVTKMTELCLYAQLIQQMALDHEKGESLPPHFETQIDLKPIKLRGSTTVDIIDDLETRNVLVPRSGKYRVMLSNMMNRIFALTANQGTESIRSDILKLHDVDKFASSLETIEWELVTAIHDDIDVKYLDLPTLEENKIPLDLIDQVNKTHKMIKQMEEREINLSESSEDAIKKIAKGRQSKENIQLLRSYFDSVENISELIESEAKERWEIIQGATKYPQSLLKRNGPPMIKSSWHLKPDFRNHPLIEKFKDLMNTNLEFISGILTLYDSQIGSVIDNIETLPRGLALCDILNTKEASFPTKEMIAKLWTKIEKQAPGLKAQVKLLSNVIMNTDTLFQYT